MSQCKRGKIFFISVSGGWNLSRWILRDQHQHCPGPHDNGWLPTGEVICEILLSCKLWCLETLKRHRSTCQSLGAFVEYFSGISCCPADKVPVPWAENAAQNSPLKQPSSQWIKKKEEILPGRTSNCLNYFILSLKKNPGDMSITRT